MRLGWRVGAPVGRSGPLAALAGWLLGRGWGRNCRERKKLECLERLPLGPQHSLHLVRAGGRLLLVSSSPAGCSLIGDLAAGDPAENREGAR